ncbi:PREDICTED: early placenta insulin-like peptide [Chinchilla lanigera]|uniref:early placenta insulin-like peptide n=1 Tax=Chinchilla lanigera TaxID=34839 RepID=UPI00038EA517|nr:PREDICTED: early placenta insulin-like peptide [Chinchilla lanigera]
MFSLLWSHLPIVWLMLSQFLRESSTQWINDEKKKLCGNEFDEALVIACLEADNRISKIQVDQLEESGSLTKTVSSSIDEDAGTFGMMSESIPNMPKDMMYEGQTPFWKDPLFQAKRSLLNIIEKCCDEGCDRKSLLEACR